jgi:CRP-like cAMP-binding protein
MTQVHQLFARTAYSPERLKVLGHAFDRAWQNIADDVGRTPTEVDAARTALAKVILNLPDSEADDSERIAHAALEVMQVGLRVGQRLGTWQHARGESMNSNRILSGLSRSDYHLLEPHLEAVDLAPRTKLQARDQPVRDVYFLLSGIASVMAKGERTLEVGLMGREAMTGLSIAMLCRDRAQHDIVMRTAGVGLRISADELSRAMAISSTLPQALLSYAHAFMLQVMHTAVANGRCKIDERLSRWLLMIHERIDGDEIALTHDLLAAAIGVRRSGITVALRTLKRRGGITTKRGLIKIVDRNVLQTAGDTGVELHASRASSGFSPVGRQTVVHRRAE